MLVCVNNIIVDMHISTLCVCYCAAYESVPLSGFDNSPTIIYVNRRKTAPPPEEEVPDINHLLHCVICILFPPWLLVWLWLCCMYHVDL